MHIAELKAQEEDRLNIKSFTDGTVTKEMIQKAR